MGVLSSPLPKPVDSILVGRHGGSSFQIGVAAMNGWRPSMEDAHVIHTRETWGFFGVLDGHGGAECSDFIARRLQEELAVAGMPENDAATRALLLRLDQEFLDTSKRGGSTGTFVIIKEPATPEGHYSLRVGNTGDSRVLLGHTDGAIFDGPGTGRGLTNDHKPDLPSERLRIERTGHKVQMSADGVARIGGDLSLSRAFGDRKYKQSPNIAPEDQAVCAVPEFGSFFCKKTEFVMLICDGICEGHFSNAEAVSLAASQLREHGDPGEAAAAVCRKALAQNSRDNLTCMIVLPCGGALGPEVEFLPGQFSVPEHAGFKQAYEQAALAAGLPLGRAIEKRHDMIKQDLLGSLVAENRRSLEKEMEWYEGGPPSEFVVGSKERTQWFQDWTRAGRESSDIWSTIMRMHMSPEKQARPREKPCLRAVLIPAEDVLRPAINKHTELKWEPRIAQACNMHAQVVEEDLSDGTSMVQYGSSCKAWLPTAVLIDACACA